MHTVVVRMHDIILTIGNIFMVSYPFKIFTSIWLSGFLFLFFDPNFFSSECAFSCTFEIAGLSKRVWIAVAVQDSRIPERKAANQIVRFYRK